MRKTILLLGVLFATTAFAQEQLSDLIVRKYIGSPSFRTEDEVNQYVWFTRLSFGGFYDIGFSILPKSGEAGREILVKRPGKLNNQFFYSLACYEDNQSVISIYEYYEDDTYNICYNALPKDAEKYVWNPTKVLSVPFDKRITFNAVGVTSPDKRKAGIVIFQMQFNTSNLQSAHMLSFDENGLKWEHPIDFDFENKTLKLLDITIDDNADIYTALISFNPKEEGDREIYENETLHFYQCGQYGEQNTVEEPVEFGHISSSKLLITKDNRLALGGYYATAPDEKETGCYIATSLPSLNRIHLNLQEFPASYYATNTRPQSNRRRISMPIQ